MQLIYFDGLTTGENEALAKLVSYKVDYNKLWGTETGRSLNGAFSGTLVGIFPKLTITIRACKNTIYSYDKTSDAAIASGKTYYTKSGKVYTPVENPVVADIDDYYERQSFTPRQAEKKLLEVFNDDFKSITYFDPYKNENKTKTFYFGDISTEVKKALTSTKVKFGQLTVEAVATTKL